ncbi:hypothetical protein [Novosphingobium sp.]|uniref:hypothetical protein n=1 Tax=Novosphingobium sp. TaxID=1874826 RepID=UPI001EB0E66C|nr:hypothetical protein [Novosphingobium sp.]MBK9011099.1 hypothetical protein [Novosphingobium sp.]
MTVDFLEFLKKIRGKFAFVATYDFDSHFFERRILPTPAFDGATVIVFIDNDRYRDILENNKQGQGFDRNYFVIPISRTGGVFHPKLYLSIGEEKVIASVGSNNCTSAGTGHNFELISTLESSSGDDRNANAPLIASIFRQFQRYAQEAGPVSKWLKKDIFDRLENAFSWLGDADVSTQDIELLSSHDGPLWPQIVARMSNTDVRKVVMLAPFFDSNLRMVERIRALFPTATIQIVSQSGYSNLPVERFVELRDSIGDLELISATSKKAGRKMHAKALAFQTPESTYWLAGSANMSNAALSGGNSEACLWFATKQNAAGALKQDDLKFAKIEPERFMSVAIAEPAPPVQEPHGLKLQSLVLTEEGQLLATSAIPADATDLSLRIFKRGDTLPTLSWNLGVEKADFVLALKDDDQAKFDQPAVGQLRAMLYGCEVKSQLCSVKQLPRLLRDRGGGSAAANRLQRVIESGDGLIEYVDALGGIDEAIDFINRTNIRFHDGAISGSGGFGRWRARDPFSGDVPEHWAIGSSGASVAELREAIWEFVQRHIRTRLERHVDRGNLGGLANFLDIFRSVSQFLLAWHNRQINDQVVISAPFVTTGLQDILATLIGAFEDQLEQPGYGRSIIASLSADEGLVRAELNRHRVPAIVRAIVDEIIRTRAIYRKLPIFDAWSQARRDWVSSWIDEMQLEVPDDADVIEIGSELRITA